MKTNMNLSSLIQQACRETSVATTDEPQIEKECQDKEKSTLFAISTKKVLSTQHDSYVRDINTCIDPMKKIYGKRRKKLQSTLQWISSTTL